jgi:hypothetical protein
MAAHSGAGTTSRELSHPNVTERQRAITCCGLGYDPFDFILFDYGHGHLLPENAETLALTTANELNRRLIQATNAKFV